MVCFLNSLFLVVLRLNSMFTNPSLQGNWLLPIYIQTIFFLPALNTCLIPYLSTDELNWTCVRVSSMGTSRFILLHVQLKPLIEQPEN